MKRIKLLSILTMILIAVGLVIWMNLNDSSSPAQSQYDTTNQDIFSPGLPQNPQKRTSSNEIEALADRIMSWDYPECQPEYMEKIRNEPGDQIDCIERLRMEISRISEIRDKPNAPGLVAVAKDVNLHEKGKHGLTGPYELEMVLACEIRLSAIKALGYIGGQEAVYALISLANEGIDMEHPCLVEGPEGENIVCHQAALALSRIKDPSAIPELMKILDIPLAQVKDLDQHGILRQCNIFYIPNYGVPGIDAIVEKLSEENLSEADRELLLKALEYTENPECIPRLRELLREPDSVIGDKAAWALSKMADESLIDLYFWMLDNRYISQGAEAMGTLKEQTAVDLLIEILERPNFKEYLSVSRALADINDPKAIPVLIRRLYDDNPRNDEYVMEALNEFDWDSSPITPLVKEKLFSCSPRCDLYIELLAKSSSEEVLEILQAYIRKTYFLTEIYIVIDKIAKMQTPRSRDVLLSIVEDEKFGHKLSPDFFLSLTGIEAENKRKDYSSRIRTFALISLIDMESDESARQKIIEKYKKDPIIGERFEEQLELYKAHPELKDSLIQK